MDLLWLRNLPTPIARMPMCQLLTLIFYRFLDVRFSKYVILIRIQFVLSTVEHLSYVLLRGVGTPYHGLTKLNLLLSLMESDQAVM